MYIAITQIAWCKHNVLVWFHRRSIHFSTCMHVPIGIPSYMAPMYLITNRITDCGFELISKAPSRGNGGLDTLFLHDTE